jgi:tellurite resistance protein TerC
MRSYGLRTARRIVVAVVGGTVTVIGIALLVLPGPAFIVIPAGIGILATEFVWARQWLHRIKEMVSGPGSTPPSPS